MEITGTIKTTIDLLKFLKNVIDFIKRITNKTKMDEVAQEIKADLSHMQRFLFNIKQRQERLPITDQDKTLQGLINDIESIMNKIQEVLKNLEASHKGHGRVLKRGRLVLGGFERGLKSHAEKLDKLKQLLEVHMTDLEAFFQNRKQVHERFSFPLPNLKGKRLDGTLEWIRTHPTFDLWCVTPQIQDNQSTPSALPTTDDIDPEGRILIISGVVGCGKSTLAAYVVNELKKQHATLFFSFSTNFRDQRDTKTLLKALISQIFQILPSERQRHHIPSLLDETKPINEPDDLIGMVVELAKEIESELYIIIDGIDESEDDWNQPSPGPLDYMEMLLKVNTQMRLLLFGRRSSLRGVLTRRSPQIELTSDLIKNDIGSFITSELKTCHLIEETRRDEIRKVLESKSSNMYLWIKYIFNDLRTAGSEREIEEALDRRPDDLDRHYSRMLSVMMKHKGESIRKRSKDLFTLIIGASRPFTMVELLRAHAFALPLSQHASSYQANLLKPESVIEACGGFISVEDGAKDGVEDSVVQLVHTSMREFFLRPSHLWGKVDEYDIEFFRLEHQDCHRMLGLSCLTYMKCLDGQTQAGSDQMEDSINDNKFLSYASHYLFSHLLESNITLQDESLQIFEFLKSGKASVLANMILTKEDEGNCHIPIQFWDDSCHFLGAWSYSDAKVRRALGSLSNVERESISDLSVLYQDSEQLSKYILYHLADYCDDNRSGAYGSDVGQETALKGKRKGKGRVGASSSTANTHRLTSRAQDNLSVIIKNLPIDNLIGTIMQTRDLLTINPIDTVMTALASSIKKMSFFTLMQVGIYTDKVLCRREQALEMFQSALQRVIGEEGFCTAWARLWVGHTSWGLDAEVHYREAMKILRTGHMNPLQEYVWLIAMGRLIQRKLNFGKRKYVADLATQFSQMVFRRTAVSDPGSGSHAGFLRDQCYRVIKSTPFFQRKKIESVLWVAEVYHDESLYEDLDELLSPFVDGTMSTNAINRQSFSKILGLWGDAKAALGRADVAMDTIECAKKRVSKMFLDATRLQLARLFYNAGRFELAKKELSKMKLSEWFRSCAYDRDSDNIGITIDTLLGTYTKLGQEKKVSQILDATVLGQGYTQGTGQFSTVLSHLLAHGLFSHSQEFILKIMPKICANPQSDNATKLNLYEALAFSARLQNGHKAKTASYNYYKECIEFGKKKLPDSDLKRILIGMGAACVAASKPKEASAIFRKLADDYFFTSYYKHFFLALACQQDGKSEESQNLLFKVVSTLCRSELSDDDSGFNEEQASDDDGSEFNEEASQASDDDDSVLNEEASQASDDDDSVLNEEASRASDDDLDGLDEEEGVVLITAYICLADASGTCADSEGADYYRERAQDVLEKKFASSLDPNSCPRMEDVSRWTSRWARSCQGYLNSNFNGHDGSKDLPEMFPFEVWWGPDVGTDYFKHFDCSV